VKIVKIVKILKTVKTVKNISYTPSSSSKTPLTVQKSGQTIRDISILPRINDNIWGKNLSGTDEISSYGNEKDTRIIKGNTNILRKFFNRLYKPVNNYDDINNDILPIIQPTIKALTDFEEYKRALNTENDKSMKKCIKSNNDKLIEQIEGNIKKLNQDYFVISVKYDTICLKYNNISLAIMILSALSTFVEALRLTITEYMKNNIETILIDIGTFTLTVNVLMLITGTIVTILSSIIRFKNYREIMEKLKNIQNMIMKYIILYSKQLDIINTYSVKGVMDDDIFAEFHAKIKEYNKEINDNINILEDIRNSDVIKLQKYRHFFDIKIDKMQKEKELKLLELQHKKDIEIASLNRSKDIELYKISNNKNKMINNLDFIKEEYEKHKFVELTKLNNKINLDLEQNRIDFEKKSRKI